MKKVISISLLSLVTILFASCGAGNSATAKKAPPIIEAAENVQVNKFAVLIDEGYKVILDVRTPNEYAAGHIEGAKLMNVLAPDFDSKIKKLDKINTCYLVYCAVGGRSGTAMQKMKATGFKSVYNLATGINGWKAAGMQLVK